MHVRSQSSSLTTTLLISNISAVDTASTDDPNEISFAKGEIMDIIDKNGKWWQARKEDGMLGST
jgi:hypothetical protein